MRAVNLFLFALPLFAANDVLMTGGFSQQGVLINYETKVYPSRPAPNGLGGGGLVGDTGLHRYLYDTGTGRYFGYDISVAPATENQSFLVTLKSLSISTEQLRLPANTKWTRVPIAGYSAAQRVNPGDTIAIELMRNPTTGQTITDYLQVSSAGAKNVAVADVKPRDFTVDDATLRIMEPRLRINGELLPDTANYGGGVTGPVGYFYAPHRGRVLVSIAPHPREGFVLGGEVRGNQMTVKAGGATYVLTCGSAIVEGGGIYNLYVLHQPNWQPRDASERGTFLLGAADRATYLVQ